MLTGNACRQAAKTLRLTVREDNPNWSKVVEDARATLSRFYAEETERNKKILREDPRYGKRTIEQNSKDAADLASALRTVD